MPIRSVLAVPLKVKNRLIGFMALFNKKSGEFTPEDQRLLSIVGMQSAQTIEAARLYEEEKKAQAMEEEMRTATIIQQNLLPKETPKIPGFDVAGVTVSAREVGGDYFDYLPLPEGRWGFVVADVAGKGLSAAMLMSNLQATVRGQSTVTTSCSHCVTNANRMLKLSIAPGRYVTLFLAALDPAQKKLFYSNGGHNPPYLFRPDGSFKELSAGGPILGVFDDLPYAEEEIALSPGDVLVIFSDGVTEAFNDKGEQFEEARLVETLKTNLRKSAPEILNAVTGAVHKFAGDTPASDDLTLMIVKAV
jgi:sigma-B regulation protein RsbU (phosphoserine phosphatase)